jgi:hypothetical protein
MSEAATTVKTVGAPSGRSLVRKLAEVMGEVERIAKNGKNDHFNYKFATEADIAAAVREHMSSRHLMLVPSVEKTEWEKVARKNGETKLCTLTVRYRLMDGDSGEEMEFVIMGQGEDSMDKGTYKAMTGATKYALMKLFLIPTGDDPEIDSEHRHTPNRSANQDAPAPQRSAPPLPPTPGEILVPFGKMKGKRLSEIGDSDLEFLLRAFKKSVDANDKTFHAKNVEQLKAAQAEAQRRLSATGKVEAPRATSPRQATLPVDGEEEIVTPFARLAALGRMHGLTTAQVMARAQGVCGKSSGWLMSDVELVATALQAVPVRP